MLRPYPKLVARVALTCVLGFFVGCTQCDDPESRQDSGDVPQRAEETDALEDEDQERPREAFGIPLPPEYDTVAIYGAYAKVSTSLSLDEVRSFYESRLVDFETVPEGDRTLYFYGLHEHQPDITARQRSARFNTRVVIQVKPDPDPSVSSSGFSRSDDGRILPPEKGTPDETTLPSGEKFAPGARWGEPYTPPPGSPLAAPRFKSNWGKPYGEWVLQ